MARRQAAASQVRPARPVPAAYDPGHDLVALRRAAAPQALVELGSNENPYGPSPCVRDAVLRVVDHLHRYPDPRGGVLKHSLAARHGIDTDCIVLGNGSHELLMRLAQVFAGPGDEVVAAQYGFAVFGIAARCAGATLRIAPALAPGHVMPLGHDLATLRAAITPATRLVYLANPNNPTGTWVPANELSEFLDQVPPRVLVVVDEAYAELADAPDYGSTLQDAASRGNVVVTRTFSKAYALAGLRVGFLVAHPDVVAHLEAARESFNVGVAALAGAEAALADQAYMRRTVARNAVERVRLGEALRSRGWRVGPAQTNFLLVEFGADAARIGAALLAAGVVLRPMVSYGLPLHLRITVGTPNENDGLLRALDGIAP